MQKSIGSRQYAHFLDCLRQVREAAGLTQEDLAVRLGETQSFVSKCERGERRMDLVELREFCKAMGITLEKFVRRFERKAP
ncbi:MAG: helix-turn-helix domain-containing protein [Acidiferrobacterales bacterium]